MGSPGGREPRSQGELANGSWKSEDPEGEWTDPCRRLYLGGVERDSWCIFIPDVSVQLLEDIEECSSDVLFLRVQHGNIGFQNQDVQTANNFRN